MRSILLEFEIAGTDMISMVDAMVEAVNHIQTYNPKNRIRSGIRALDDIMIGFQPGLYTFGARPGVGKTNLMLRMTATMADDGHTVLYFSTEMRAMHMVLGRIFPAETGIDAVVFRQPERAKEKLEEISKKHVDRLSRRKVWFCQDPSPTIEKIGLAIDKLRPNVVVVDYIQRCMPPRDYDYRVRWEKMIVGLKGVASKHNLPILLASALKRGLDKGKKLQRPTLEDLSETAALERESETVVLLWPDNDAETYEHKVVKAYTAKMRNGTTVGWEMLIDRRTSAMLERGGAAENAAAPLQTAFEDATLL